MPYGSADDASLPLWVRRMYSADPNLYEVEALFKEYYSQNVFVKNQHTQYYKRWKRKIAPWVNSDGLIRPLSKPELDKINENFISQKAKAAQAASDKATTAWGAANWKCIGPFDYDKDAGGKSHAPGSSHVYTLEKAPSNPDILYCGTSEAGVWKTTDRGLNWTSVTHTLPFLYCNAIEIHPTDPNIVWIGANNGIYKSTNGGTSWAVVGDAALKALAHTIHDLVLQPGNPNVLFVASNKGFFRSTDGGDNYTKTISTQSSTAYFSEIEIKPNDPNTLYVIQSGVSDKYTELLKSADGGVTFTLVSGWPVLATANSKTIQNINRPGSGNGYASFSNDHLGTATRPDFTIEMRVKVPSAIADKAILSNKNWGSGNNVGWVFGARYTGELLFNMGAGSSRLELLSSGIWDNQWHHVAIVWRASGSKEMYKDGVLVASSSAVFNTTNTAFPMILGRDGNLAYGGYDIDLDDIRIWNTPLSQANIAAWQNTEVDNTHPNYSNLLHYYKCNEPSGTIVTDELATNSGTITGLMNRVQSQIHTSTTILAGTDHQRRAEISVTAAKPNRVYALLSGSANGGSGLYGVYVSDDAGLTWSHKCCGAGPGGAAIAAPGGVTTPATNANMLGYSETGGDEGGQYYYDLAMDADPNNGDKVHIAGICHWYSVDGGNTFRLTAKWSWPDDPKYIHADIHGIHIYGNEVWVNCDGGIYLSTDSGKTSFNKRQYGIAGTTFWGFGMGHKDGEVMIGGTYHNSHLLKNNNVYLGGWTSYTGSADGTRGFVNPGKPKEVYNDSRRDILPANRLTTPTALTLSKLPNKSDPTSKIAWDPRCYNCIYTGTGTDLWYSEDDGVNWTLVKSFAPQQVGDIEIGWDDPNVIWVTTSQSLYITPKQMWRSLDKGVTWVNMTPSSATLGYNPGMYFDVTLGTSSQDVWFITSHLYGWYVENTHKVFYSSNGGTTWTDWTTPLIATESINDIFYQRGTNGGVYIGTRRSCFYRNKSMSNWVQYDNGLPPVIQCTRILPWYKEAKLRYASNRSVWESPFYEPGVPHAQPMVDKLKTICQRDTFYFADYSAHYKTGATFAWSISPSPTYSNSLSLENPKVVFGTPGIYTVGITVTDSLGTSSKNLIGNIEVIANCAPDTLPDKALNLTANGQYAEASSALNISSNTVTMMAWVKPTITHTGTAGVIFFRNGSQVSGIHIDNNNELRYHWGNTSFWGYSSGLNLPVNEWSHVAVVISPTNAKLYLNGRAATNTATHSAATFNVPMRIGNDPNSSARTFRGMIDEVVFYNRSLSQDEVREQMHLSKKPEADPNLLSYYQFNETTTQPLIMDRKALRHALFVGGATRMMSTVPVGGGTSVSSRLAVTAGGTYSFGATGLSITFPASGNKPNGDLVVTRINLDPDTKPDLRLAPSAYWVINNFGTNQVIAPVTSMVFSNLGNQSFGDLAYLYKRKSGQDGATWGTDVGGANSFSLAGNGSITSLAPNVTGFSQFAISSEDSPLPVHRMDLKARISASRKQVDLNLTMDFSGTLKSLVVERSVDGLLFETIGAINPDLKKGNQFAYSDFNPVSTSGNYYRIKATDQEDKIKYSNIAEVRLPKLFEGFVLTPNPVKSGDFFDVLAQYEGFSVKAIDAYGRILIQNSLRAGSNRISSEGLKPGAYFLEFSNGTDKCLKRLIVQ